MILKQLCLRHNFSDTSTCTIYFAIDLCILAYIIMAGISYYSRLVVPLRLNTNKIINPVSKNEYCSQEMSLLFMSDY